MKSFGILFFQFWVFLCSFVSVAVVESGEIQFMSNGEDPEQWVRNKVNSHEVMVFARSYGPHNEQAKDLLKRLQQTIDVQIEFLDVDLLDGFDSSLVLLELQQLTGQWALPNIFIGKKHVGGNSELDQIHALGELEDMLRAAGNEL